MAAAVNLRARVTLDDCREAYAELRATADPNLFRRRWFGFIALLRAVGHGLGAVDGAKGSEFKKAINNNWTGTEPIFRSFIKGTRDNTVHEYRSAPVCFWPDTAAAAQWMSTHRAMAYEPRTGFEPVLPP